MWCGTSHDFVSHLAASRPKKLAPLANELPKLDFAVVSILVFQELSHLLAIFLDCSRSPCRSLLISKPTLWRQNDFVVFFRLGDEDENRQALFSSLEAFTFKLQGKTVSTILANHDFCQIAWLAWFNSGRRIKYDRTCQRSIKIISIEKTFALHKSAQKKHFFLEFFLKESSWWDLDCDTLSYVPRSGYITARDQSMVGTQHQDYIPPLETTLIR